jgi:hypothetical protein
MTSYSLSRKTLTHTPAIGKEGKNEEKEGGLA